jgi:hypothetical protein
MDTIHLKIAMIYCHDRVRMIAVALGWILTSSLVSAQVDAGSCGDFTGVQWDYRKATPKQRIEVEGSHFRPETENLIRGYRGPLGADLSYTLRASPNHLRALISLTRWSERLKKDHLPDMPFPAECYFERAIRFQTDDHAVRMLYALFLIGKARPVEAASQLESAARMAPDNPFTMYNIGMVYCDMKNYTQALGYAHKAMTMGFTKRELRQCLETAGRWVDPVAKDDQSLTPENSAPAALPAASAASQQDD